MIRKLLILLIAINVLFLAGCKQVPPTEKSSDSEVFVAENLHEEDGYLWYGSEKFLDVPLSEWLGGPNYNVGIWFQQEEGDQVYIYFSSGTDCGGCFQKEDDYMIIDKLSAKISRNELNVSDDNDRTYSLFSSSGNGTDILSPDKTKVAFVDSDDLYGDSDQSVYIYDFVSGRGEKYKDLPSGQKIAEAGPGGVFLTKENALYWNEETGELVINP